MTDTTLARFDFPTLRRAVEGSDAGTLTGLYAEDAELTVVDRDRQPSKPLRLSGRQAIADFWRDICGRAMTHSIGHEVVGERRVAFVETCAYPDGCNVVASQTLDIDAQGRIARHLVVQAWDAAG